MLALLAAFGMGCLCAKGVGPATAEDEGALSAQIVDVPALTPADLGPALAGPTPRYLKVIAAAKTGTVQVQIGDTPKHVHEMTDEIQYIVEGTGTMWLGGKEVPIKPGDLVIVPRGTPHAGTHASQGPFKIIAFKTPPQAKGDFHPAP